MLALWLWWLSLLAELLSFGSFSSTLSWTIRDAYADSGIIYAFLALVALSVLFASYNVSSWWRGGVQRLVRQRLATTIMAFIATAVFAAGTGYTYMDGRPPVDLSVPCTSRMLYACSSIKALSIFIPAAMSVWGLIFLICIGSYCSGTSPANNPQANNPEQPPMGQYPGPHPPPYPAQHPGQYPGPYLPQQPKPQPHPGQYPGPSYQAPYPNQYQYGYYPNQGPAPYPGAAHPPAAGSPSPAPPATAGSGHAAPPSSAQPNSTNLNPVHVDYGPLRPKYDPASQYPTSYPPPAAPPSATHPPPHLTFSAANNPAGNYNASHY